MKVEIDINGDTADLLIVENLKQTIAAMREYLERRKNDEGISMFSTEKERDIDEMIHHIQAFQTTLSYFVGGSNEDI